MGKRTVRVVVLLLVVCLFATSCSKRRRRPPQKEPYRSADYESAELRGTELLGLESTPAGAKARLSTGESCVTPCRIRKNSRAQFSVTFQKEGYVSKTIPVSNNLEALRQYNLKRGKKAQDVARLRVEDARLVPNPVRVTLEPEWTK